MELTEMTAAELIQRQKELAAEIPPEERDAMTEEEAEKRTKELEAVNAELEAREKAEKEAAETRRKVAEGKGKTVESFKESEEKKMFDVKSVEYRDMWIRNLQGKLSTEERATWTTSTTNAIPTMVSDKFFEKMVKLAPMLSEITLLRVAGNLKFIAEGTRNTATEKHVENSAVAASEDTTVSVTLGAFEFMKVIQISRTASMMSIDAFENWLVEMLAGDIARAIDNYILNDSTNGICKMTYTTTTHQNQIVKTEAYTYDNIVDLIALMPAAYDAEAKFLTNKKTLYGEIAKIKDSVGNPIFVPDTITGVGGRLMGYPVIVDDYVPAAKKALYLGKWTDVVGNLPEEIHVDRDESAGFTSNSIMYRGIAVFDSKAAKTDAIYRLQCTTSN